MAESASRAIFIGGVGRSGTTLIVDLLGCAPDVSPIYETDFVVEGLHRLIRPPRIGPDELKNYVIACRAWAEPLPLRPHNKRPYERYVHGPHYIRFTAQEMDRALLGFVRGIDVLGLRLAFRRFVELLFAAHTKTDGKRLWVNKTPAYVSYLDALLTVFPEMMFVHVVRDPRDTVLSMATRPWGKQASLEDLARYWKQTVNSARAWGAARPTQYYEVGYEETMTSPIPTLASLYAATTGVDEERAAAVAASVMTEYPPLDPGRVYAYRTHTPQSDVERIEGVLNA